MIYDTIIVGAGAAGLMTAITAGRGGLRVLLLDGQNKVGAKILMSGGTRCNVTNKAIKESDYNSEQIKRVRSVLRAFDNHAALEFFKEIGVECVLEPTGKYFPTTNSGKTVLEALLREITSVGVVLKTDCKVNAATFTDGVYNVRGEGFAFQSKSLVLATGGLSYPSTGSDGVGYRIAKGFGHNIIDTQAALTPLTTDDADFKALSGLAFEAGLSLWVDGKKTITFTDGFLIAHFGFSGPTALDISRHYLKAKGKKTITVNFLPTFKVTDIDALLLSSHDSRQTIRSLLVRLLPSRLVDLLMTKAHVAQDTQANQLKRDQRIALVKVLSEYPLAVTGVVGYSKAEVTAGGVDLSQINPATLESQLQKHLYFTGEICDVDGRIGGFNFQWAWASGYVAARAIVNAVG